MNKSVILQNILTKLIKLFDIKNVNIDQPLQISNIRNTIFSTTGVLSIIDLQIQNISGIVNNRQYSDVVHDIANNTFMDLSLPPRGGIYFLQEPNYDIIGKAS